MKLIILAAGIGSRLRPITLKKPKCLLNIKDTTIMGRIINQFQNCGVKKILIVTGHLNKKINFVYKNKHKLIYYPKYKITNNFHTLWHIRKELNEDCIISFSDLIIEDKIARKLVKSKHNATAVIDSSQIRKDTMMVKHKKKILQEIIVKNRGKASGNFIGIFAIKKKLIKSFLNNMKKLLRNSKKDYYVKVLNYMIKNNIVVNILDIKGNYWREIDTFNEYKKALKEFK